MRPLAALLALAIIYVGQPGQHLVTCEGTTVQIEAEDVGGVGLLVADCDHIPQIRRITEGITVQCRVIAE